MPRPQLISSLCPDRIVKDIHRTYTRHPHLTPLRLERTFWYRFRANLAAYKLLVWKIPASRALLFFVLRQRRLVVRAPGQRLLAFFDPQVGVLECIALAEYPNAADLYDSSLSPQPAKLYSMRLSHLRSLSFSC